MNIVENYNSFILEKEFQYILDNVSMILESNDNGFIADKLKNFLSKLSKEDIRKYFIKLMNKIKGLPDFLRRNLIITYTSIFLLFSSMNYLVSDKSDNISIDGTEIKESSLSSEFISEIINLTKKSSFSDAQKIVKLGEAGYSNDKDDDGNWMNTKEGRIFIGTNHGISAQTLDNYLKRIPTQKDMINLSYTTSLKIYKVIYWMNQNLGTFSNQSVVNIIYDGCVNQGINGMSGILKKAYIENGIKISDVDNPYNKKWIKKANALNQKKLFNSIRKFREEKYKKSKTYKIHGSGWMNRLDSISYK